MTQDEIAVMDGGKCILQLRGVRPFFSDKYDITQHPNYKYLSDYDKKTPLTWKSTCAAASQSSSRTKYLTTTP